MTQINDWNEWDRQIIEEFRANGGNVGGQFAGAPLLLLTTTGAKSGQQRTSPLAYLSEGGQIYVFAGNRGAPTNPGWYHNLVAHPDVTVEVGAEKFEARAIVVNRAEADPSREHPVTEDTQSRRASGEDYTRGSRCSAGT